MRRTLVALPAIVFAATFGVFFVHKNREARTVFRSGRGLLVVAAIVVGYVAIAWLLRRVRRWWLAPIVSTAVVLGLAAWIVRPYYVDDTANRQLVSGPVQSAGPIEPGEPVASTPPPGGAVRVSTGNLRGVGHDARGGVSVIEADGKRVVRFQSFDIEGTPDPRVYVINDAGATRPTGGVELGRLSGNRGDVLDFAVPAGAAAGPGWTVLVWCRAFAVPIAVAPQSAA